MRYVLIFFTFCLSLKASSQSRVAFIDFYEVTHHSRYDSLKKMIDEGGDSLDSYITGLGNRMEVYLGNSRRCMVGVSDSTYWENRNHELDSVMTHFMGLLDSAIISFEYQTDQYIQELNRLVSIDSALFCEQNNYTELYWEPDSVDSIRQTSRVRDATDDFLVFLDFYYSK